MKRALKSEKCRKRGFGRRLLLVLASATVGLTVACPSALARPSYTNEPSAMTCAVHVCVHWAQSGADAPDLTDADGNGVPDYVEFIRGDAERTWQRQTAAPPAGLGWRTPLSDGDRGGTPGGELDVYLIHMQPGYNGYADKDDCAGTRVCSGSVDLDPGLRGDELREVIAHEFNHVVSFAYAAFAAPWLSESTAVWMSDKANDGVKSWAWLVAPWTQRGAKSILDNDNATKYGDVVWLQWLDRRYGADVIRDVWEQPAPSNPTSGYYYYDVPLPAFDTAIRAHGGLGFSDAFVRFAAALPEWREPAGAFADGALFPDVLRTGTLAPGAAEQAVDLPFPSFALLDVPVHDAGTVRIDSHFGDGDTGGVAVVARSRNADGTVRVTTDVQPLPEGGPGSAELQLPPATERVTAVVVNAQETSKPKTNVSTATVRATFAPQPPPAALPEVPSRSNVARATKRNPVRVTLRSAVSSRVRRVVLHVGTDARATVTGRLRILAPRAAGRSRVLAPASAAMVTDAAGTGWLRFPLSAAARRRLARAYCHGTRHVTLDVALRIVPRSGPPVRVRRRLRVALGPGRCSGPR